MLHRVKLFDLTALTSAALIGLIATGCGAAGGGLVDEPEVELVDARLTGLTTSTMDVELDFMVDNPNNFEIPIVNVAWELDLWQEPFAEGNADVDQELPAADVTDLTVPVSIPLEDAISGGERLLDGQPIPYLVTGDVVVDTAIGNIAVPYDDTGDWENPLNDLTFP